LFLRQGIAAAFAGMASAGITGVCNMSLNKRSVT
jgi:hypothetical protein